MVFHCFDELTDWLLLFFCDEELFIMSNFDNSIFVLSIDGTSRKSDSANETLK